MDGHQFCEWWMPGLPAVVNLLVSTDNNWMPMLSWSRHAVVWIAIAIFYASLNMLNVKWHQTFLMLIFYTTYEFLSNFLTDLKILLTDIFASTCINRSIDILLEFWHFLSEQRAPFSTGHYVRVFFFSGGFPHPEKIWSFPPPIRHLSPFLDQGLSYFHWMWADSHKH